MGKLINYNNFLLWNFDIFKQVVIGNIYKEGK